MRLHHVQVTSPPGGEDDARRFWMDGLCLTEIEKPEALRSRGGAWFRRDDVEVHIGIQDPFAPARKGHPALELDDVATLETVADRLASLGFDVDWSERDTFPGYDRCYAFDAHGNRVELLAVG